jgi:hypothetical protein
MNLKKYKKIKPCDINIVRDMSVNTVANSVMLHLYLWHDIYNIVLKL